VEEKGELKFSEIVWARYKPKPVTSMGYAKQDDKVDKAVRLQGFKATRQEAGIVHASIFRQ
jgi:hypothetical protein